jgi:hypothetical protein
MVEVTVNDKHSSLSIKYDPIVEVTGNEKHSILSINGINYGRKSFVI